jgi:hypothetical protein
MNARLVTPSRLVSLAGIEELRGIASAAEGGLRIGAMTRHGETASDARLAGSAAVIRSAAGQIANPVIRNMGTIGGSIAFADPAADSRRRWSLRRRIGSQDGKAGARRKTSLSIGTRRRSIRRNRHSSSCRRQKNSMVDTIARPRQRCPHPSPCAWPSMPGASPPFVSQ